VAKTYSDMQKQIQALQAKAAELRKKEAEEVIARIKEAIAEYQLTASDLGLGAKRRPKTKAASVVPRKKSAAQAKTSKRGRTLGKVPVKYRDKSGNTWTGRGNQPVWLREAIKGGAKLESFRV
jgi:DNA-binding protein H-NS